MHFSVEPGPRGRWRVILGGADGDDKVVSVHDTEEEARTRAAEYLLGAAAAAAPTVETGLPRGDRITLSDGTEAIVRPVRAEDAPLLLEGFAQHFGEQSRYQRFLSSKRGLTPRELEYFTDVDHDRHEAIGALDPVTGLGVGIARFVREATGSARAEAAVAVADEWQHRGLGAVLLDRLAERAREIGVREFTASLLTTNRAMLALFDRLGDMRIDHEDGTVLTLEVRLAAEPAVLQEALRAAARGDVR